MSRIVNGSLYIDSFISNVNPGEYSFVNALYDNQADATGNGSYDVQPGFILYIQATDPISALPVPGVVHRYRIKSIQNADGVTLSATIVWDEDGSQIDLPTDDTYAIICENTNNNNYGLISSNDVYINLPAGISESAYSIDLKNKTDKFSYTGMQGVTGLMGAQGNTGTQGVTGIGFLDSFYLTDTNTINTTSVIDELATSMSVTPESGTYAVFFSGSFGNTNASEVYVSIYKAGSQIASSEQRYNPGQPNNSAPFCTTSIVSVDGTQAVQGYWRVDANTGTMYQRQLLLLRLSF